MEKIAPSNLLPYTLILLALLIFYKVWTQPLDYENSGSSMPSTINVIMPTQQILIYTPTSTPTTKIMVVTSVPTLTAVQNSPLCENQDKGQPCYVYPIAPTETPIPPCPSPENVVIEILCIKQ